MIKLFKEFTSMKLQHPMNESIDCVIDCNNTNVQELCSKIKEMSVNINYDIMQILPKIKPEKTYHGMVHSTTCDIIGCKYCSGNNSCFNSMTELSINGDSLIKNLSAIPAKIMGLTDILTSYQQTTSSLDIDSMIKKIHLEAGVYSRAVIELVAIVNAHESQIITSNPMNEVATEEDVKEYKEELENIMEDIRKYYEDSDYAKLLTPRKKQIDKMYEYVKGALERKYTLKVPLYKVENADKDTRDIVENIFIKDIQGIVSKYNNYVILSPNWDEDEDIFIYLTLKEPFGEEGDKKERADDSKEDRKDKSEDLSVDTNDNKKDGKDSDDSNLNEAAGDESKVKKLTKEERDALRDDEFGIPSMRRYPLNDEAHIREAIRMFHFCKPEFKEELAKNICRRVKKLKLVGKVTVSQKNPFKKFFPDWMIEGGNKKNESKKEEKKAVNESVESPVFINGKLI